MEDPADFPRAHVVGANVPGCGRARAFRDHRAENEQIPVNGARRTGIHKQLLRLPSKAFPQVDASATPEAFDQLSRTSSNSIEPRPGCEQDASLGPVLPINHTAIDTRIAFVGARGERIKLPESSTRGSVKRKHFEVWRSAVQYALDDDRIALNLRSIVVSLIVRIVGPGDFKSLNIRPVDLSKPRIVTSRRITFINWPFETVRSSRLREAFGDTRPQHQEKQPRRGLENRVRQAQCQYNSTPKARQ
jgi:hypothetical protein